MIALSPDVSRAKRDGEENRALVAVRTLAAADRST